MKYFHKHINKTLGSLVFLPDAYLGLWLCLDNLDAAFQFCSSLFFDNGE